MRFFISLALILISLLLLSGGSTQGNERATETATFGAGCFWGVESAFRQGKGVTDTVVGYMGGTLKNPTYEQVSTHRTGYSEVCRVTYDPARVSYEKLVQVFFQTHKPEFFSVNDSNGVGQYGSAIYFHNAEQEKTALAVRDKVQGSGRFDRPITTAIVPASEFWRAEEYHQHYAEKHHLASCHITP
ncbi:MAG: peptide-methionine (S)-S-oxide reductase MsrA [Verrucomicrobiia bacterium]